MQYKAITIVSESRPFSELISDVGISVLKFGENGKLGRQETFWTKGLWDTGATNSAISSRAASFLKLTPDGEASIFHWSGIGRTRFYVIDLVLPNLLHVPNLKVTELADGEEFDVIIGMDVIRMGDFAITNKDGRSVFSFCHPSLETIDFAERIQGKEH